jgi:hypothetical protein
LGREGTATATTPIVPETHRVNFMCHFRKIKVILSDLGHKIRSYAGSPSPGMSYGLGTLPEESVGSPDSIRNDIQSLSWYRSVIPRRASNVCGKIDERRFLNHVSWRTILHEKNLLVYWPQKATRIPATSVFYILTEVRA